MEADGTHGASRGLADDSDAKLLILNKFSSRNGTNKVVYLTTVKLI